MTRSHNLRKLLGFALLLATLTTTARAQSTIVETTPASGYRGIWYAVGKSDGPYVYKYSGGLGTYCAKHRPFAVYRPEVNKTFFCYGGTTDDSHQRLLHMVSYYDHESGQIPRPRVLLDKQTGDAHDNPVISLDDEGHVWIFSTSHGRSRPSYVHRSVEPYQIDRFERVDATYQADGEPRPLDNFSYFQVWRTKNEGFAAFFTRYHDPAGRTSMYMNSRDGRSWSEWTRLAAIDQGHYQVSAVGDGVAATAFNYHPNGKGLDYRTNLYYLQTTDGGQTWTNVKGERTAVPLTEPDNACLISDYRSESRNVYMKDLVFDPTGAPVILVVTSDGHEPGPENGPRQWELHRYADGEWHRSVIAESDNNYDTGSLYFEGDLWRLIAPTDPGPQAYNPGGEMVSWVSDDLGRTWRREQTLTRSSERNHTYARRPVDAHPDFYTLWADGHGRQPSESRLHFANQAGEVFTLPAKMDSDFATPARQESSTNR